MFKIFEKKFFGPTTSFFLTISSNIKGATRGALQVWGFMMAWLCLQILNLQSGTPGCVYHFFKKNFRWP